MELLQEYWYILIAYACVVIILWEISQLIFKRTSRRVKRFLKLLIQPLVVFKNSKVIMLGELIVIVMLAIMILVYIM